MKKIVICAFVFVLPLCQIFLLNGVTFAEETTEAVNTEASAKTTDENTGDSSLKHFTDGISSGILSLMYTPVKLGVSIAGGIVGGIAYPLSGFNANVSKIIWDRSLGGSYFITSDMLNGKEDLDLFIKWSDD
ncbi:MAG: hypothetical protein ACUZ8H_12330 [Candidatus Anammoxibacter sp.]